MANNIRLASSKSTLDFIAPEENITAFSGILKPVAIIEFSSASEKSSPIHPTSPVEDISTPNTGSALCRREKENAISEHVEFAGVHSGDATLVFPAQKIYFATARRIKKISRQIAKELNISGPFNIQFLARNNEVKVIECNLRASRSFPFVSKVLKRNFIETATRIMLDAPYSRPDKSAFDIDWIGVKASQFSFSRLHKADPVLGVDMSSTGEVGCDSSEC